MTLDTIRTRPARASETDDETPDRRPDGTEDASRSDTVQGPTGVVEVSDLTATRVSALADDADVYLERRAGRTYLVPAN